MPENTVSSSTPRVCSGFTAHWTVTEVGGGDVIGTTLLLLG